MISPPIPENEKERINELLGLHILNTLPEDEYDAITRIAASICGTRMALLTLIDSKKQWFKSTYGLDVKETAREIAFCAHAINYPSEVMEVEDARKDRRFCDNPFVLGDPYVVFYTGVPLKTHAGNALGTLCVIDNEPKKLNEFQMQCLKDLSHQVIRLFELHKMRQELEKANHLLTERNEALKRFAEVTASDLRSPLSNIAMLSKVLADEPAVKSSPSSQDIATMIQMLSDALRKMIRQNLKKVNSDHLSEVSAQDVNLSVFFTRLRELVPKQDNVTMIFPETNESIRVNEMMLTHALLQLVYNGIKFNNKQRRIIVINLHRADDALIMDVIDNGMGLSFEQHEAIQKLFHSAETDRKKGFNDIGIGLLTVKRIADQLRAKISLHSTLGHGTTFRLQLPNL